MAKKVVEEVVKQVVDVGYVPQCGEGVTVQRASHLGTSRYKADYAERALDVHFAPSVTDTTQYQSNAQLIQAFMTAGQALAATRQAQYDFEDGEDTGIDYPISRHISAEPAEVYQALQDMQARARNRAEYRRIQASNRADKENTLTELKDALQSLSGASADNPADKSAKSASDAQAGASADK